MLKNQSNTPRHHPVQLRFLLCTALLLILGASWMAAPAAAHPLDPLARFWDRGSFDSSGESLQWHFEKHGREVGALDVTTYARKAEGLYTTVRRDRWESGSPVPGETPYVRRFVRGDRYIDLYLTSSRDRLIISFGAR